MQEARVWQDSGSQPLKPANGTAALKTLLKVLGVSVVIFAVAESAVRLAYYVRNSMVEYIPLPYMLPRAEGPIPPWRDQLSIIARDDVMLRKYKPHSRRKYLSIFGPADSVEQLRAIFREFIPRARAGLATGPVWETSLNADGFRDDEFVREKLPTAFRIMCLGDSWTYGQNVNIDDTYPRRLRALLEQEYPGARFEVLNVAVQGYASYHGVRLLRSLIDFRPDVVVIAFAMNDFGMRGARERDPGAARVMERVGAILERVELYKLARYWLLLLKFRPKLFGDYIRDWPEDLAWKRQEAEKSLSDYERNHAEMIDLAAGHGARVILLYNELWTDGPYLKPLEAIARVNGVPLIDASSLIAKARKGIEADLESRLDLRPSAARRGSVNGEIEVVFRLHVERPARATPPYIVGAHPKLGGLVPNRVRMYDDGTHGDQRPDDQVWSYSASFPRGTRLFYVYTDGGKEGRWDGLDVQFIRTLEVDTDDRESIFYAPVESFGKIPLLSDRVHTDRDGYQLIARAVLEVLMQDSRLKDYVSRRAERRPEAR